MAFRTTAHFARRIKDESVRECAVERAPRDAIGSTIYSGSSEQRNVIALRPVFDRSFLSYDGYRYLLNKPVGVTRILVANKALTWAIQTKLAHAVLIESPQPFDGRVGYFITRDTV